MSSLKQLYISLVIALACVAGTLVVSTPWKMLVTAALVASIVSALHATWRIGRVVAAVRTMVGECGKGNLEPRLWIRGESGELFEMMDAINHMVDMIDAFIREAKAAMQSAMAEKYFRKIQLTGMAGTYRQGAQIFNEGLDKIRENTLRSIRHAVNELDTAAKLGDTQAKELLSSASVTTESISSVAAAMEEMSATISEIARQVDQATKISGSTTEKAKESSSRISELMESVKQISAMTSIIQEITNKTNLLALNATIEAARAGDAGKGFAVVAGEVKSLATNTAHVTSQISANVERVHEQMDMVMKAISEMMALINRVDEAALVISSAMTEQSTATQEITRAVGNASTSSQSVANTAQQVAQQASRTWEVSKNMHAMCA